MNPSHFTLFSFRNLLLVVISVSTTRSLSANIDGLGSAIPSDLDSLNRPSLSFLDSFFEGQAFGADVELIPVAARRSVIEDVLGENEFFILTSNAGSATEAWLAYLAPAGLSLDLVLNNAGIGAQTSPANPQSALSQTTSTPLEQGFPTQGAAVPFEVFIGLNLASITSLELDNIGSANTHLPQYSLADFVEAHNSTVPEPSAALLLFLAFGRTLFTRRRGGKLTCS